MSRGGEARGVMSEDAHHRGVTDVDPMEAYVSLRLKPSAAMIDVRTRAEWLYVGGPDLSAIGKQVWPIEWRSYPNLGRNAAFEQTVRAQLALSPATELYFLARAGGRSREAATALLSTQFAARLGLYNIVEGFEGELNEEGRRGLVNGWKARNLPWRQS